LELNIEPLYDNAIEYDLCPWHGVNINCSSNASFDISKDDIASGGTKISNSTNNLSCFITLYANNGAVISITQYERHLPTIPPSKN